MISKKKYSPAEALYRAAALCSKSEQCSTDIIKKLRDWGVDNEKVADIICRLTEEKYIDDTRFMVAYCRDKFRFEGWGRIKIRYNLRQKGMADEEIKSALDEIDEDDYKARVLEILQSKKKSTKTDDVYKLKASLFRFASSRGFEPAISLPIISDILKCDVDEYETY